MSRALSLLDDDLVNVALNLRYLTSMVFFGDQLA